MITIKIHKDLQSRILDALKKMPHFDYKIEDQIEDRSTHISLLVSSQKSNHRSIVFTPQIPKESDLQNTWFAGVQRHLCIQSQIADNQAHKIIFLNQIKRNPTFIELFLRDVDSATFSLSCLKRCEIPELYNTFPNGLFTEEACQIARYSGISNTLNRFEISNFILHDEIDFNNVTDLTIIIISEMIWYFSEGVKNRINDDIKEARNRQTLHIESSYIEDGITIYKSLKSGRLWIKAISPSKELFACSDEEYKNLCNDQIPERIMMLIR